MILPYFCYMKGDALSPGLCRYFSPRLDVAVNREDCRSKYRKYDSRQIFDPRDVLSYDLEAVASRITGPDHYGDREQRRERVREEKFHGGHLQHA